MELVRDIKAEITFTPTSEGGRKIGARSGYSPQFFYAGQDWCARHAYEKDEVLPGETVTAYLTFLNPGIHVGKLRPGMEFLCREGNRTIARGHILEILELEQSARRLGELPNQSTDPTP